jgi:5'-phosphate synthase pdxT subunit
MTTEIGVLALQGDFDAHRKALEQTGSRVREVRSAQDLPGLDGLVIPGGESTTILKLLALEHLFELLRRFGEEKPIFGTCAGAILLASEVVNPRQECLGLMDMTVQRNGYGRQVDSRITQIDVNGRPAEAVFIRAPIIRRIGKDATVLATYNDSPVLVEQGRHMVATFHPELSRENGIHQHFVDRLRAQRAGKSPKL